MDKAIAHWSSKSWQKCLGLFWLWLQTGVGHGHCARVDAAGHGQGVGWLWLCLLRSGSLLASCRYQ